MEKSSLQQLIDLKDKTAIVTGGAMGIGFASFCGMTFGLDGFMIELIKYYIFVHYQCAL